MVGEKLTFWSQGWGKVSRAAVGAWTEHPWWVPWGGNGMWGTGRVGWYELGERRGQVCGTQPEHQQRAMRPQKGSGRILEEKSAGKGKQKCKQRTEQAGRFAACMEQDLHGGFGRKHVAKSQCQKRKMSLFWASYGTKLYLQVLTTATTHISLGNSHWTSADSKQSIYIYSKPNELVMLQRKLWWAKLLMELNLQHWFYPPCLLCIYQKVFREVLLLSIDSAPQNANIPRASWERSKCLHLNISLLRNYVLAKSVLAFVNL